MALDEARLREQIAARLREWLRSPAAPRDALGRRLAQDEIARPYFDISPRQFSRWLAAASMPEWKQVEKIAQVIGVPFDEILATPAGGEGPEVAADRAAVREELPPVEIVLRLEAAAESLTTTTRRLEKLVGALPEQGPVSTALADLRAEVQALAEGLAAHESAAVPPPGRRSPRRAAS